MSTTVIEKKDLGENIRNLAKNNCPVLDIIKNPVPVQETIEFRHS